MKSGNVICILAKNPKPGKVKGHLEDCLGKKQAALLARALLLDTISAALRVARSDVMMAYWPADAKKDFADILFLLENEEKAIRIARKASEVSLIAQKGGDLGEKLNNLSRFLFGQGSKRVLFVCSDNPLIEPLILRASFELLKQHQVVVGPTFDGRHYLIGTNAHYPSLFNAINWNSASVYRETLERIDAAGLRWQELELSYDVDRPEELRQLYCDIDNLRLAGENEICYHTERCLANLKR